MEERQWLKKYIEYTSNQESPDMFHLWSGFSVIASTLERNVWIDRAYYDLYPNLYVVLVGGSAVVRKSTAINIAFNLYKKALPDYPVFSQRVTPEAMIGMLSNSYKNREISSGYIVADELSTFLGGSMRDSALVQILTKLYDCTNFDYHTIVRGKEKCMSPCCNMLGGTTPEWIKMSLPAHAVGGGFTSRIVFVYQEETSKRIAFPTIPNSHKELKDELIKGLRDISVVGGEMGLTQEARDWYKDWYVNEFNPDVGGAELRGYLSRKHDILLKLGMILSVNRDDKLIVEKNDLERGLSALNENEKYLGDTIKLIQARQVGEDAMKVVSIVRRKKEIAYSDLLRSVSYFLNARQLNEVLESLLASKMIQEKVKDDVRHYLPTYGK